MPGSDRRFLPSSALLLGMVLAAGAITGCATADNGVPPGGGGDIGGVAPKCDGPCMSMGCTKDGDCFTGQHCDKVSRMCVDCLVDKDCAEGKVCQTALHTCVMGCSSGHTCGDAGICEADLGICIECAQDSDCTNPKLPRCNPMLHRCGECLPQNDNCGANTYCGLQGVNYVCLPGCKTDNDCTGGGGGSDGGTPVDMSGGGKDAGPADMSGGGKDGGALDMSVALDLGGAKPDMAMPGPGMAKCEPKTHQCVQCLEDSHCPPGSLCQNGTCVPGCTNMHMCNNGLTCCAMSCVEPATDNANCGACGVACPPAWQCCGGKCFNPANDVMNCGGCGMVCMVAHGTPACVVRNCTVGKCDMGWADCNGVYKDGCETNVDSNVNNCGACNNPCKLDNANPKCTGGMCQIGSCMLGFSDCNKDPKDGCEVNSFFDVNNCGACNAKCAIPHGTPKCNLGQCQIAACDPGWLDCNNNPADGCEVNILTDVNGCGGCGKVCSKTNGTPMCVAGTCQIKCNPGFANCDGDPAKGCDINLNTDVNHCGNCNSNCNGKPQHVMQTGCSGGMCVIAQCEPGYYNVPPGYANGCPCASDAMGGTCQGALSLGSLVINQGTTASGNLVAAPDKWFSIAFQSNTDKAYHPRVKFNSNPGNIYLFDVYATCSSLQACNHSPPSGTAVNLIDWDVRYTAGDPAHNFVPIPPVGNGGSILIRVHRTPGAAVCDQFQLALSNIP